MATCPITMASSIEVFSFKTATALRYQAKPK